MIQHYSRKLSSREMDYKNVVPVSRTSTGSSRVQFSPATREASRPVQILTFFATLSLVPFGMLGVRLLRKSLRHNSMSLESSLQVFNESLLL